MPSPNSLRRTFLGSLPLVGTVFAGPAKVVEAANAPQRAILARLSALEVALKAIDFPIGTIVSCTEPLQLLRSGLWLPCDGKDQYSRGDYPELYKHLLGLQLTGLSGDRFKLPNLEGRTVRGIMPTENALALGGADVTPILTTTKNKHDHSLPNRTGLVALVTQISDLPQNKTYSVEDNYGNGQWRHNDPAAVNNQSHLVADGGLSAEGQHLHDLGGKTGETEHDHQVGPVNIIPSYVALLYFIKARMIALV